MGLTSPQYLRRLAEFAADSTLDSMSPEAREAGRTVFADCLPVIAAGMQVDEMKRFSACHLAGAAAGRCWVIGTGRRATALDAALVNGTAGTWLELDEGNLQAKGHPGIQVVPAAVAMAQEVGASGADLLAASTIGYEVGARISRAADVHLSIHPHGTYGVIEAAVAVGRLRRFSADRMLELINCAATMGMATSRNTLLEGSTVRNIYTGHSGHAGITAARLVECGFTGEADSPSKIYGSVLSDRYDPDRVVEGLGSDWLVAKGYFKLHPTGRYVHAAIDALEAALATVPGGRIDPAQVERIDVRAYKLAAMLGGKNITSSFGARFSIPFALGTILHHGGSTLAAFEQPAVDDPAVQALVARVFVEEDTGHSAVYPGRQRCDLVLTLKGGRRIEGHCEVMKGEPEHPHQPSELRGKFFALGEPVWGNELTARLYEACATLERIPDFGAYADQFNL